MPDDAGVQMSFKKAWAFAQLSKGWLERDEADLLYQLTREARRSGRIVEVGSYCGRSSIVMAAALNGRRGDRLVCVDTFRGSSEHQFGERYFDPDTVVDGKVDTYPLFEKTLASAGLLAVMDVMKMTSRQAAALAPAQVSLLFLDADHSYAGVQSDIEAWLPRLTDHGRIVLHDVGHWEGPTRGAADLLALGFRHVRQSGSALALERKTDVDT
jgi:predicted O-methyltransferase YrrM